jgi:DNA-binding MarR family transcriptional regulator
MNATKHPAAKLPGQKLPLPSQRQAAIVMLIRATAFLREFGVGVFAEFGITNQQYNVLRILRGAVPDGLPTLDIAARMIDKTPGITRLLDRLEAKKLVRRERPAGDRRQVLCYVTKKGLEVVRDLDAPLKSVAAKALSMLDDSEVEQLSRLLEKVLGKK